MKRIILLSILPLLIFSCADEYNSSQHDANGFYSNSLTDTGTELQYQTGDDYADIVENPFISTLEESTSTFSIDADGGAYANSRRFILNENQLPPAGAVRTEEFINYFDLDYPFNSPNHPITLNGEVSSCPWYDGHKLVRIGMQGKPLVKVPASNFVFLIDVSGSMSSSDKLDLLKEGFKRFSRTLTSEDRIAIVTYAGSDKVALPSTPGSETSKIVQAINSLGAGGGTAGAAGIVTAYEIAQENMIEGGNNRIILGTDGDFNIGISNHDDLVELIEEKRETGIFLTAIGVGRGNLYDHRLEQIANHGNGTYEYVNDDRQIDKIFIHEKSKFFTVAKDVKVQIQFNPEIVQSYRLIGYENRVLENEDFEDDKKDAGEIGADQNITALYEIIPVENVDVRQSPSFTIDFRYKLPDENNSLETSLDVYDLNATFSNATNEMKFVASVSSFALLLRDSEYKGNTEYSKILEWLSTVKLEDPYGYKEELVQVIKRASSL